MLKGKTPLLVALVLAVFAGAIAFSAIKKKEADVRRGWNLVPVVVAAPEAELDEANWVEASELIFTLRAALR